MLTRIRSALAASPPAPVTVPRDYERSPLSNMGDVDRFADTVAEYHARVHRVDATAISIVIASLVATGQRVAVPADLPKAWIESIDTVVDLPDAPLTVGQLDRVGAVVTGCAWGIASTGTLILDTGKAQGRRALTLVPDHHICVVFPHQIVDTVPQGFAALDPFKPLTFISGPSATSDIELTRIEGVHGPRSLDVLLVDR
ncbi:lactate utilization protein C [Mycolicibacterium peregrinum]|uniref:LutC/YkgG family protein n=1 Tax=Mycolicibacterium peregrinum TaxID=43304 RepID=UPI0007EB6705|nr:LUD domain-containing protein [Mycolicibacterium peregrinum]OBF42113.1 lactate utilization protein C [Mycolicibacterium peregrinum]